VVAHCRYLTDYRIAGRVRVKIVRIFEGSFADNFKRYRQPWFQNEAPQNEAPQNEAPQNEAPVVFISPETNHQ
jgi:hypothetical protein